MWRRGVWERVKEQGLSKNRLIQKQQGKAYLVLFIYLPWVPTVR